MEELTLRPIEGVAAQVEVHADNVEGLLDIESNTHIYVLVWLHRASRALMASESARGMFGLRSPARPNLIGLSAAKLLRFEGRMAHLDIKKGGSEMAPPLSQPNI
jgi:tRNA (Thr-GGU) A37 N-methylase